MAKPKVTEKNDPPRYRAWDFRDKEKRAELASQRSYTKEARSKRWIHIDPNMPKYSRGFIIAIHAFREGREIDKMIANNITAEARAAENSGET